MSLLGNLGSLVVSLETNISQFLSDCGAARQAASQTGKSIEQSLNGANDAVISKLQALAVAAVSVGSVVAVKNIVQDAVAATAAFDDMAERTGVAVEQLSVMSQVAKIGGQSLDLVEGAAGRLIKGLSATDDETKGVGRALDILGIKAKDAAGQIRPMDELLPQIARELSKYSDSSNKTALAQDLFGKSGAKILPFLNDYVELGDRAAVVTGAQAAAAEKLEKSQRALNLETENTKTIVVNALVPSLQGVVQNLTEAKTGTDSLQGTIRGLAADGTLKRWAEEGALAIASLIDTAKTAGVAIITLGVGIKASFKDLDFVNKAGAFMALPVGPGSGDRFTAMTQAFANRQKSAEDFVRQWEALLTRDTNATRKHLEETFKLNSLFTQYDEERDAEWNQRGRRKLPGGIDPEAAKAAAREIEKLKTILESIDNKDLGLEADYSEKVWFLNQQFLKGRIATLEQLQAAVMKLTAQQPVVKRAAEQMNKVAEDAIKLNDEQNKAVDDQIKAGRLLTQGLEFEAQALTMTNTERQVTIALRQLEQNGIKAGTAAYDMFAARIRAAVEAKEGLMQQIDMWKSIESAAHSAWQHIGENAGSVIKQLGISLKSAVLDLLYQLTVRRWIINIGADMSGIAPAAFAQQMGLPGAAASVGSNFLGAGTVGGSLLTGAGTAVGGSFGAGLTYAGSAGAIAGAAELGGAGTLAFQVGAAMPMIGMFVAAAYLIYTMLQDAENPTFRIQQGVGGSGAFGGLNFSGNYNADTSQLTQLLGGFDERALRLLSPSQQANVARNLGSYTQSGLRGDGQPAQFAFPEGDATAAEQIAHELLVSRYATVFDELNPRVAALIRNFKGTSTELQALISTFLGAEEFLHGMANLDPMADIADGFDASQRQIMHAAESNSASMQHLIDIYDGSAAATTSLTQATTQYYLAQVQLGVQIREIRRGIDEMFSNTVRNIRLSGLDTQGKYNFFEDEANSFMQQLMASSDPEQIRRYAERINDDINSAFGLLSPEEQASMSGDFVERLARVNAQIDDRLDAVNRTIADDTQSLLGKVHDLLEGAAISQQAAADTQVTAAGAQLDAAHTPRIIRVELAAGGQVTTFDV